MRSARQLEQQRIILQRDLDKEKTQLERNRLGQFATPPTLADAIIDCALGFLPPRTPLRFLDPAFGTGSFLSALQQKRSRELVHAATGFEIDPHFGKPAKRLWAGTKLNLQLADFTRRIPPRTEAGRYNLLVCNPPYVRHHHITAIDKMHLQSVTAKTTGIPVGGLAGLYCYFLAISHNWMRENGVGAWLTPSEFMDVGYGRSVKRYLLSRVTLLRVHRFAPDDVQFGDALVSSAVFFFRKSLPPPGHAVHFTFGGTLEKPKTTRNVSSAVLTRELKWTRFPVSQERDANRGTVFSDLFQIKRGIATGDNSFFVLPRREIERRELPIECFRPILPSPRNLASDEVLADDRGLPLVHPPLFLLNCRLPEEQIRATYPNLWRYLEEGKERGVSDRYLCKSRSPWYAQEIRIPPPFLLTYMGRGSGDGASPFRFILNHSQAIAANVYLLLYPREDLARAIQAQPSLASRIWQSLSGLSRDLMLDESRVYGGGLHKIEPGELGRVRVHEITNALGLAAHTARSLPLFTAAT